MNPEQQRVAIAEACGWSHKTLDNETYWWHDENNKSLPPSDDGMRACPNYLNDLNAMHDAEKVLTNEQDLEYSCALEQVVEGRFVTNNSEDMRRLRSATASQRAEAFLRTIGKWEESK